METVIRQGRTERLNRILSGRAKYLQTYHYDAQKLYIQTWIKDKHNNYLYTKVYWNKVSFDTIFEHGESYTCKKPK